MSGSVPAYQPRAQNTASTAMKGMMCVCSMMALRRRLISWLLGSVPSASKVRTQRRMVKLGRAHDHQGDEHKVILM